MRRGGFRIILPLFWVFVLLLPLAATAQPTPGYYYIRNNKTSSYYLNESSTNYNNSAATPYVKLLTSGAVASAVWELRDAGGGFYYIIHHSSGKYIVRNGAAGEANAVHLETTATPGDDAKFCFPIVSSGVYAIVPYAYYGHPSTENISFNPHGGFSYNIGFWSYNTDRASRWQIEPVYSPLPELDIVFSDGTCSITCSEAGVSIYYTADGSTPTAESTPYSGPFVVADNVFVIKAIGYKTDRNPTPVATLNIVRTISSLSQIASAEGVYRLTADVSDAVPAAYRNFSGRLDGDGHTVSGLSEPLFATLSDDARVCNLNLSGVSIAGSGNTGAVAGSASGTARIYNVGILDGEVSSAGGYCGGIVGLLDGSARVVNCFSFANVTGGTSVGGIVGYNNVASTAANLRTMVMNCMFYGNVSGTTVSPVYGGQIINNNSATGLNNFNYYSAEDFTSTVDVYNCALGAEKRFLQRFEFYRQILNSNRELAAWYVFGTAADARTLMYKWVLDKAVAPYPILKPQGKYTSIINYDATAGEQLGTLSVTISDVGSNAPTGATIGTSSLTLLRTGKDPDNYNFNYDKVQLPYYNDVGTGNYTDNKVVTGWEITAQTGGTAGTFTTGTDAPAYNFADRNCTQKDIYSVTGRVFSQGAYFDVPEGVTAITIRPHWAKAAYLSDPNYDKTYTSGYAATDITAMGTRYNNNNNYDINGSSQKVYTTMAGAINALARPDGSSVYDYAVVLVGNYHQYYNNNSIANNANGFTIMSADLDGDNEPDNCFIYQHTNRLNVSPIRFDFICWPGIGMAQKPSDSGRMPNIGIFQPRGWFELTNTCIAQFFEVEYDFKDKANAPLILLGGVVEQIVSTHDASTSWTNHTQYIHIGSNVWFKQFSNGVHSDVKHFTSHHPISVTGGDYDGFYLSGMFRPDATVSADNAECYISGGRFDELAGAGQQQINGNVSWQISYADIQNFYGGGINDAKPITGSINVDIRNSNVEVYCGGPKFGDMTSGQVVVTNATDCTFGRYFGAGYGGTSYNRVRHVDNIDHPNYDFNDWVSVNYGRQYSSANSGIATSYEYELFAYAGFGDDNNVGRFYVNYASLSLATTYSVTSTLTGCTVLEDFYGGGNLGKVNGNTNSTLTDCIVKGNVFGAGFSAAAPTVDVMPLTDFVTEPYYDGNSGFYTKGEFPAAVTYTWKQVGSVGVGTEFDDSGGEHYIHTTVDMASLGTVAGNSTLTVTGSSQVGTILPDGSLKAGTGNVYGGGNEGVLQGNSRVVVSGSTVVNGNVYGGGNLGQVGGNTEVVIRD